MAKWRWLIWGLVFSAIIFIAIYFLIYIKVQFSQARAILKLGKWDISFIGQFLRSMKNVVITSLVLGFLLGAIPEIRLRKDPIKMIKDMEKAKSKIKEE